MASAAAVVVGSVISSRSASKASDRAVSAQVGASDAAIAEQRAAREADVIEQGLARDERNVARARFEEITQPFADIGLSAGDPLRELLGLDGGNRLGQLEEINPLLSFLRDEGFTDIQESAAARGRLGAGGTLKDLTRFNTQLATTVVPQLQNQRFNQLFNVLGLGSNVALGQGVQNIQPISSGVPSATNIGNLLTNAGNAQAQGFINQGNATTGLVNNLAGIFGAQQGGFFNSPQQSPAPVRTAVPASSGGFTSGAFS